MVKTADFSAFGKNDIRGIYGENVTEELFYYIGKGLVKYIQDRTELKPSDIWVTVSRDARLHSESLTKVLIKGIVHMGANAINLDVVPTPLGYYSEFASYPNTISDDVKISAALIVTASHNPPEYNGLKITFNKSSLNEEEIKTVKEYTIEQMNNDVTSVKHGESRLYNIIPQYIDSLLAKFGRIGDNIKVVTDSANGTAGVVAPKLYSDMGCEVIELYSDYVCPLCYVHNIMLHKAVKEYSNIKIIHHNYPFDKECNPYITVNMHPNACFMAKGAIAARNQGNYWEMSSLLYENQPKNTEDLTKLAKKLDFDEKKFIQDFESKETFSELENELKKGENLGIDATPTMIINGKKHVGVMPYHELEELLEKYGAKKR